MKLRPYPTYKRFRVAGVDSAVPAHWKIVQLGRLGEFFKGVGGPRSDNTTAGRPCIRYGDIYTKYQYHVRNPMAFVSESTSSQYTPIRYGDVLFAGSGETLDDIGKSVASLLQKACAGGDVIVLRPSALVDPVYFGYAMESAPIRYQKACAGRGVTVMHVYASELKNVCVTLPGFDEQRIIATFLDHHTAKINALIDKARHLIERLQEKRRALITEIVTRGLPPDENRRASLDPCPKMRPSGVEWLGDVPAHWKTQRSDRLVRFQNLDMILPATFRNEPVVHYSIPSVQEVGAGIVEDGDTIQSAKQHIKNRVLLVSRLNPRKSTICYAEPDDHLTTVASVEFVALLPLLVDSRYLYYLAHSELFRQRLDSHVRSVTRSHQRTPPRSIRQFWHAWPPQAEQNAIATFLDRHTAKIDALIDKSRTLIERLREKRQATITAAVTGQIDVRDEGRGKTE